MDNRALIKASLSSVRNELAETFPHLTDDMLDWAPGQGMRTIKGQFVEIMATEQSIVNRLSGQPRLPYEEIEAGFLALTSVSSLVDALGEVREETLRQIEGVALDTPVEVSEDFANWLELPQVPASEMFRFLARHESYHAGQLVSYLWARGNNPYDWE